MFKRAIIEIPVPHPEGGNLKNHAIRNVISILLKKFPPVDMDIKDGVYCCTVIGNVDDIMKAIDALKKGVATKTDEFYGPNDEKLCTNMEEALKEIDYVPVSTTPQQQQSHVRKPETFIKVYRAFHDHLGQKGTEALAKHGFVGGVKDPRIVEIYQRLLNDGVEKYYMYVHIGRVLYEVRWGDYVPVESDPDTPYEQVMNALENMIQGPFV